MNLAVQESLARAGPPACGPRTARKDFRMVRDPTNTNYFISAHSANVFAQHFGWRFLKLLIHSGGTIA